MIVAGTREVEIVDGIWKAGVKNDPKQWKVGIAITWAGKTANGADFGGRPRFQFYAC